MGLVSLAFLQRPKRQLDVVGIVLDEQNFGWPRGDHGRPVPPSVKKNVEPRSTAESAHTLPPCLSTMRFTIARPTPVPSKSSARCMRWKTPNSFWA